MFRARPPSIIPTFFVHAPTSWLSGSFMACRRCSASTSLSIADSPSSGYAECAILPCAVSTTCSEPLLAKRQAVLGRFAIDHEARADRMLIRLLRPDRVALLAHQKQQPHENARRAQLLSGDDLGRDDALGIARPATVNPRLIFRRRDERRHGIHVRGENNLRPRMLRPGRQHVVALAFHRHLRESNPRRVSSAQRKSPTGPSCGVVDSMSIRRRISANRSRSCEPIEKSVTVARRWSLVARRWSLVVGRCRS